MDVHVVALREPLADGIQEVEEGRILFPLLAVLQHPIRRQKHVLHTFGFMLSRGVGGELADLAVVPVYPPCVGNRRPKP